MEQVSSKVKTRNTALLFIAAIVWGISFVFQQLGGKEIGPFTFNSIRMLIGALAVYIAALVLDKVGYSHKPASKAERKKLWKAGLACGITLAVASNLQQLALNFDITTGKAGFLTAMYIILVPIIGLFFHSKCSWNIWAAVVVAIAGLYFLSINGSFSIKTEDLLLYGCALFFAFQIIAIDKLGVGVDSLRLSSIEFLITGVVALVPALIFEIIPYAGGFNAWIQQFANGGIWISLLYMGLGSCAVAYTLEIIGMKGLNPTVASLVMSFEAVFSLIAGIVFLGNKMSTREIIGCCLMFAAICLSQIVFKKKSSCQ